MTFAAGIGRQEKTSFLYDPGQVSGKNMTEEDISAKGSITALLMPICSRHYLKEIKIIYLY